MLSFPINRFIKWYFFPKLALFSDYSNYYNSYWTHLQIVLVDDPGLGVLEVHVHVHVDGRASGGQDSCDIWDGKFDFKKPLSQLGGGSVIFGPIPIPIFLNQAIKTWHFCLIYLTRNFSYLTRSFPVNLILNLHKISNFERLLWRRIIYLFAMEMYWGTQAGSTTPFER